MDRVRDEVGSGICPKLKVFKVKVEKKICNCYRILHFSTLDFILPSVFVTAKPISAPSLLKV